MHPNEKLIEKFYQCFQKRDYKGMNECYHQDIEFSDAVFIGLKGERAKAMWQMLCERAADLEIKTSAIKADDNEGKAHWEAFYTFSQTGNKVHNKIDAVFQFKQGKIVKHTDSFDLWAWAAMALGIKGKILGWFPPVQAAIRKQASDNLEKFINKNSKS
ncbi:MAG: nuclear transport factor 2 family protein [Blastocatellia bacterium]|nr:nuclear transport factor 2 family protein [Blastocatellia bacterium]MBL8195327.1 nuclear transport factor 2 family protein [Blastocatellia bacterium]MBN8725627.1 nuclear transport factor 2 family protein [Acidobacteriota bacterium]